MTEAVLVAQHDEIQEAIFNFGEELKDFRESMAYAAPEVQDEWWPRIAQAGTDLADTVVQIITCRRCPLCPCTD